METETKSEKRGSKARILKTGEKFDYYKSKERFEAWKLKPKIKDVSKQNEKTIKDFLLDFEIGQYTKNGGVGYKRLLSLKSRMSVIARLLEEHYNLEDLTQATNKQITELFNLKLAKGEILSSKGTPYESVESYRNVFKTFWHYYQLKQEAENEKILPDITKFVNKFKAKPNWVYINDEEYSKLHYEAKPFYKLVMDFLRDTGIRSPSELQNARVMDVRPKENTNGEDWELYVRPSKTGKERRINLNYSKEGIKKFVEGRSQNEQLFQISPVIVNQYFRRLVKKVLGEDRETKGGNNLYKLSLYDFRHISACFWIARQKNTNVLLKRFDWKGLDMLLYYTQLIGLEDTTGKDDLLTDTEKTGLQKDLEITQKRLALLNESVETETLRQHQKIELLTHAIREALSTGKLNLKNFKPVELPASAEELKEQTLRIYKERDELITRPISK